jgi:hypothetical protein
MHSSRTTTSRRNPAAIGEDIRTTGTSWQQDGARARGEAALRNAWVVRS